MINEKAGMNDVYEKVDVNSASIADTRLLN